MGRSNSAYICVLNLYLLVIELGQALIVSTHRLKIQFTPDMKLVMQRHVFSLENRENISMDNGCKNVKNDITDHTASAPVSFPSFFVTILYIQFAE